VRFSFDVPGFTIPTPSGCCRSAESWSFDGLNVKPTGDWPSIPVLEFNRVEGTPWDLEFTVIIFNPSKPGGMRGDDGFRRT
jgi:hypothetical protein